MVLRNFVVIFVCLFNLPTHSQTTNPVGAQPAGMGGVCVAATDIYSAFNNQAGLTSIKKFGAVVNYENRFLLSDFGNKSIAGVLPIKAGVFAIDINSFGNKLYSENKYGLAFAKGFGELLSIGVQLDYLSTRIAEGYGTSGVATAELGIQSKPMKNLIIGVHIFNPTRAQLANYNNERLPAIFKLGCMYLVSEKVKLAADVVKDIRYKPEMHGGIEYKPINILYLRVGVSTQPVQFSFGMGVQLKEFRLDISSSYQTVLGNSPQIGLVYLIK